jgi:DNA-binding winged helix-turn-helix (wHTH) protein/Tol biopolymer transport system component
MRISKESPATLDAPVADCYEFGPFRLDLRRRQLLRDDDVVALTPKAFDLLQVLVTHADRVVEKDELMKRIWPDSFVGEDSLTQNVAVLRKVLGDASDSPKYIATIHKHGYRFVACVREIRETEAVATQRAAVALVPPPVSIPDPAAKDDHQVVAVPARWTAVRWVAVVASGAAALLGAMAFGLLSRREPVPAPMRFVVTAPENTTLASAGFPSPDGRHVAFIADHGGRSLVWIRSLESVDAHPLTGTDGVTSLFWSPDGRAVGFFAAGKLKVVNLAGGPPQTLAIISTSNSPTGGTWNADGLVLYSEGRSGLKSIPAAGGAITMVTTLDAVAQETGHQWPQFLPGGRRFVYGIRSANPERNGIYVGSLDSPEKVRVLASVSRANYAKGYLVFVQDRALVARAFDPSTLKVSATLQTIAGDIANAGFAPPNEGLLTYLPGKERGRAIWFDRTGSRVGTLETPSEVFAVALSPDERQLAAGDAVSPTAGIWLFDLRRHSRGLLSTIGNSPVWSRDGSRVVFASSQEHGVLDLYQKASFGNEPAELLLNSGHSTWPHDWSPDGRFIVYTSANPKTKMDIWLLSAADRKPIPYLETPFNELQGQVSPDGRWMAYTSDESGTWETYVQSFPVRGHRRTISTDGGAQPRWRRDGKELFYLAADRRLMSVKIQQKLDAQGVLEVSDPEPLFQTHIRGPLVSSWFEYTVTANGQRFLICETERMDPSMTALVNWTATLGR